MEQEEIRLRQVSAGDEKAFKALFDQYRPNLYTTALRITNNDWMAEDIVQDTFVKVWVNRACLPSLRNFEAWLYVLAKNITLNVLQKKKNYKAYFLETSKDSLLQVYPEADYELQDKEFQSLLQVAIARLPQKQQATYRLIKEQYLKREEVAQQFNVSAETVKSNLDQAMKSIRAYCMANIKDIPLVFLLHFFTKYF